MSGETPGSDTNLDARRSAGERLRAAREAQGLRVDTAAEALGFARSIVVALEADDYARLGAPVYVRGYLRKYARYLGLPGDELVARYELGAAPSEPELTAHWGSLDAPRRGSSGRRWLVAVVTIIVIAILVIAALWGWRYARQLRGKTRIPPAAAASAAAVISQTPARSGIANLPPAATRAVTRRAESAPSNGSAPSASSTAVVPGEPQLELHLTAVSWVEVRAADHTRLYYDLAAAGKTLRFNDKHGALTVYLGNAAGVKVEVNGRPYPIPAAGRKGDTARFTVTLAPAKSTAAAPPR